MTNLQTGIAVVLAIIVVGAVFVFPRYFPLQTGGSPTPAAAVTAAATSSMSSERTELQVTDVAVGTGASAVAGDTILVNYTGMLADGTVFDASANHGGPAQFKIGVGQVIKGWDQGIVGMKEGGKRHLVIPADLAYGAQGYPGVIPPNATLTFDVELLKVNPK